MTYNQAQELGGKVRAGEKGTAIVFAGAVTPKDESGQPVEREGEGERRIPFLKRYYEIGRDTSELQSLMRISYAVFCLKKKKKQSTNEPQHKPIPKRQQNKHTSIHQ